MKIKLYRCWALMRELILALEHAEPGKREAHLTALMLLELQGAETAPLAALAVLLTSG